MSLVTFLKNNVDVRERFKQEFYKPQLKVQKDLLAPPLTKRYSTVGTAFDYMLRFYIKRLNPNAIDKDFWVAERALDCLGEQPSLYTKANKIIEQARERERKYQQVGEITDELIESALSLAYLDPIYRAGRGQEYIGVPIDSKDIEDVKNLMLIVRPEIFTSKNLCMLNPTFGEASRVVSGADADVVIDDNLIDVKTTKTLEFRMPDFHQLMGYYVLHQIGGLGGLQPKPEITKVSIYFSRYAYLHTIRVENLINKTTFPNFLDWFIERANQAPATKG